MQNKYIRTNKLSATLQPLWWNEHYYKFWKSIILNALDDTCHLLDDIIPLLPELYILFVIHLLCNGIHPCLVKFDVSVSLLIFTYLTWWLIPLTWRIWFSCISLSSFTFLLDDACHLLLDGIHPLLFKFDCRVLPYSSFTFIFLISPHSPPRVDIHPHLLEFYCHVIPYLSFTFVLMIISSFTLNDAIPPTPNSV